MPSKNLFYYLYHPDVNLVESGKGIGRVLSRKISDNFMELLLAHNMRIGPPIFPLRAYLSQREIKECYEGYMEELGEKIKKSFPGSALRVRINVKKCVVNFGEKGIFEVGMALHPIFGVPYIPGSAIKGVFKRILYGILEDSEYYSIFSSSPFEEEKAERKQDAIAFTDALPDPRDPGELCVDVICTHVPSRGSINELGNPNPVSFWILRGSTLVFYIYPTGSSRGYLRKDLIIKALEKLKSGSIVAVSARGNELIFFGVGAKTSYGYGHFNVEGWEEL